MADGAISCYVDQFVVGRLARSDYETPISVKYGRSDPDKKYLEVPLYMFFACLAMFVYSRIM